MQTATTLANTAISLTYKAFSRVGYIYYCNATDGKIYRHRISNGNETLLPWPISSMKCSGRTLVYDSDSLLVFPFQQNGLSGVAELLDVDP